MQFLQLKIRDLQIACTFSNIFRPRDDLCTFDNNKFKNYYNDIYLNELEFKKTNEDSCKTAFLDLSIKDDRKIRGKLILVLRYQSLVLVGSLLKS